MAKSPQHQGVFWLNPKSQKLKFHVSFLGLNIALSPNLIGSSDADFNKDSKSGLHSKIKNTNKSFGQATVEVPNGRSTSVLISPVFIVFDGS